MRVLLAIPNIIAAINEFKGVDCRCQTVDTFWKRTNSNPAAAIVDIYHGFGSTGIHDMKALNGPSRAGKSTHFVPNTDNQRHSTRDLH